MAFSISATIEKMAKPDKDFRYMALSDLYTELQKDSFKLDSSSEENLSNKLLERVVDSNGDVQGMAVKCLGALVKKVADRHTGNILDKLLALLLPPDEGKQNDKRDIASLGLNNVIDAVSSKDAKLVVGKCSARLIAATSSDKTHTETKVESLQLLEKLLNRFGSAMTDDLEKAQAACLPQLKSNRSAARKRAIQCLAQISTNSTDKSFQELMEHLLSNARTAKSSDRKSYLQALSAISVSAGFRLGKYMHQLIPLVAKVIKEAGTDESDEELRENCLQTFEAVVVRCPKEVSPFLEQVVAISLDYLKHDPNLADADDTADDDDGGDDGGDDDDDGGDYSADDDISWKVRRASARVLGAVIHTRPDLLLQHYEKIAPGLISRFKEREETVRVDVFQSVVYLLRLTASASRRQVGIASSEKNSLALLRERVPSIVAGLQKQVKDKSAKTRVGAFSVLRELLVALNGGLDKHLKDLVPGIVTSLTGKQPTQNIKIEALSLIRLVLSSHPESVCQPHVKTLLEPTLKCAADSYYKTSAEALRVTAELVRVIRPPSATAGGFDYKPFVKPLYATLSARLKAADTDQEVKEAAIESVGRLLAGCGDELSAELKEVLPLLQERLVNEITRLTAVKALTRLVQSPLKLALAAALPDATNELAGFLRKQNRPLKQATLTCLDAIVVTQAGAVAGQLNNVIQNLVPLVHDSDLHLTFQSLQLTSAILKAHPDSLGAVRDQVYPRTLELLHSSLLQGTALNAVQQLYGELVHINDKKFGFDQILDALQTVTKKPLPKGSLNNVAQCIAAATVAAPAAKRDATVDSFLKRVQKPSNETEQVLSLLALGEIGRRHELGDAAQKPVLAALDHTADDVKSSASFALGAMAVGSMSKLLPVIVTEIKSNPRRQYLLLQSLREVVGSGLHSDKLAPHIPTILPLLLDNTGSEEEGARNVAAECLGKLALVSPDVVTQLQQRLGATPAGSSDVASRSAVVSALKFAIVDQPHPVDTKLLVAMPAFLECLKDPQIDVRRSALLLLNWAAHNKPGLVAELLPRFIGPLYEEAKLKEELIRYVDLGPFKHKVDDGLENRKAAFECLNTLLEQLFDQLELTSFVKALADGLKDQSYDVKSLAHMMTIRLAKSAGPALVDFLSDLVEPLRTTITTKPAQNAVKQDIERNDELVRSALRAVFVLESLENSMSCAKFQEFMQATVLAADTKDKYDAIKAEQAAEHGSA